MNPDGVFAFAWVFVALAALVAIAATLFWLWALVDCLQRDFEEPSQKVLWVLVIVFVHFVGALLYVFMGRAQGVRR